MLIGSQRLSHTWRGNVSLMSPLVLWVNLSLMKRTLNGCIIVIEIMESCAWQCLQIYIISYIMLNIHLSFGKNWTNILVCRNYNMKNWVNPTYPHALSLNMSLPLHYLMKLFMMNKFLIQFMLLLPSLIRMLPPSIKKKILKSHLFLCLYNVIFLLLILLMKNK